MLLSLQIGFIREAFPFRSKDDITLVLQSCDYDVEAAIACFTNGGIFFFVFLNERFETERVETLDG